VVHAGGWCRSYPFLEQGVPYFVYYYYGPGRHAKIVSTAAKDLMKDGNKYHEEPPLTGDESVVAEVTDGQFPQLLHPVDDLPPATVITETTRKGNVVTVSG